MGPYSAARPQYLFQPEYRPPRAPNMELEYTATEGIEMKTSQKLSEGELLKEV